jgi:HAD superfamily hydrolase (TIGR01509 family)
MALASSNNKMAVDSIIEKFGLRKYLKVAISGDDVTNGKPDPEIFLKASEKMNIEPHECLVIEDAANGVIAAKAAGMKCIGLQNKNSGNQDLSEADLVVNNFNKLDINLIKDLCK